MKKERIVGYKLVKYEYEEAACKIAGVRDFELFSGGYAFEIRSNTYNVLQAAGVLDLWFEPVFKNRFKIGDWVKWGGMNSAVGQVITPPTYGDCYKLEVKGKTNTHDSCSEKHLTYATQSEIIKELSELNRGLRYDRIKQNAENADKGWNNPEKTFAAEWNKEVENGTLNTLLTNNINKIKIDVTPEIKVAVATIIQWLGTNVGMAFIKTVLNKEDYHILHESQKVH